MPNFAQDVFAQVFTRIPLRLKPSGFIRSTLVKGNSVRKPSTIRIHINGLPYDIAPPDRDEAERLISRLEKWLVYYRIKEIRANKRRRKESNNGK